ncbi:unnamed protein product, partial [Iphiclides podalirius]
MSPSSSQYQLSSETPRARGRDSGRRADQLLTFIIETHTLPPWSLGAGRSKHGALSNGSTSAMADINALFSTAVSQATCREWSGTH